MTSLHPPSPAVGRPLWRLTSGCLVRLRQCRMFSSITREAVISRSVAMDTGAMLAGRASTGAGIMGWFRTGRIGGMSEDCGMCKNYRMSKDYGMV